MSVGTVVNLFGRVLLQERGGIESPEGERTQVDYRLFLSLPTTLLFSPALGDPFGMERKNKRFQKDHAHFHAVLSPLCHSVALSLCLSFCFSLFVLFLLLSRSTLKKKCDPSFVFCLI